jgi:zinc transport system ATP-binding protein
MQFIETAAALYQASRKPLAVVRTTSPNALGLKSFLTCSASWRRYREPTFGLGVQHLVTEMGNSMEDQVLQGIRMLAGTQNLKNMLEVADLSVRFENVQPLHGLSFSVARGASLAVIGPNGAGKTILFRAIIGATPFEGTVRWARDARIGYVPQKLDLDRDVPITALDFLATRKTLTALSDTDISRTLELVGIPPKATKTPIGTLSGGQFQRLLIAFALLGKPNVLLLDELTAGVDAPGQRRLNELVARLQRDQGLTVLFISHELSVVYRYAGDVLCIGGSTVHIGPPRVILTPDLLRETYGADVDYHIHDH